MLSCSAGWVWTAAAHAGDLADEAVAAHTRASLRRPRRVGDGTRLRALVIVDSVLESTPLACITGAPKTVEIDALSASVGRVSRETRLGGDCRRGGRRSTSTRE